MSERIAFDTAPESYRHWRLELDEAVAHLTMCVAPDGGLRAGYELKLNSYDLSVDIELHDIVQRLRFEHPDIRVVVLRGGLDKVFCAGANIQMLASSTHVHKVNFCKFTNETRNSIEEATTQSGQVWIAAVNGTAAGGGYELALACDEILLVDDRSSAVSLPEVPLLGVLPGTGGLTRVIDKRHVRRDRADVFATRTEGIKGQQAVDWGLVDQLVSPSLWDATVQERAAARAATSDRPANGRGIALTPLAREGDGDEWSYRHIAIRLDRANGAAHITVAGPDGKEPDTAAELADVGADAWVLAAARELDHAVLDLRFNESEIGTWVLHTAGESEHVARADRLLGEDQQDWLVREVRLLWARTLKRLELSARTIICLVEPGSCFAGTLAELVLLADQSFMLDGLDAEEGAPAAVQLTTANDGWYPMSNGLSRLATRFWGRDDQLEEVRRLLGKSLVAADAAEAGLVTFTPDEIDWDDEVRIAIEERASFSPDALTGMEANLRFPGPETMETKIFARLSAWQNWIFQRPNAVGSDGALRSFGTGKRPQYDRARV